MLTPLPTILFLQALALNPSTFSCHLYFRYFTHYVHSTDLLSRHQVAFVDSYKDELAILAASAGEEIEHDVPGWRERLRLHRLELTVSDKAHLLLLLPLLAACFLCSVVFLSALVVGLVRLRTKCVASVQQYGFRLETWCVRP